MNPWGHIHPKGGRKEGREPGLLPSVGFPCSVGGYAGNRTLGFGAHPYSLSLSLSLFSPRSLSTLFATLSHLKLSIAVSFAPHRPMHSFPCHQQHHQNPSPPPADHTQEALPVTLSISFGPFGRK